MKKLMPTKVLLAPVLAAVLVGTVSAQTTMNVRDADIRAFIADAARVTGRTFIIDARVQGKVTVVTDRPLSRSEYFEVFLSTLRANGLVAVPTSNGAFRIQPSDNSASQPSRIGASGAARNSLVTEIVRLRAIDAASAVDTVRALVSAQGSVTANRGGNSIVIVDFADNVRRVREVLRRIDTDNNATRVIALKNAGAREIATALQALVGTGGQGATPDGGARASASWRSPAPTRSRCAGIPPRSRVWPRWRRILTGAPRTAPRSRSSSSRMPDAEQLLPVLQQLVGQTPSQPTQSNTLSRSNFGGTGNNDSQTSNTPAPMQQAAPAAVSGGTGQPAIVAEGGRTAAVVTRFTGANAIVIAAPAEVQRQLSEVVRQLDTRREQVLVEAIVAEVSDATASKLGVQFLLAGLPGSGVPTFATAYSNSAPNLLTIAGAIGARSNSRRAPRRSTAPPPSPPTAARWAIRSRSRR